MVALKQIILYFYIYFICKEISTVMLQQIPVNDCNICIKSEKLNRILHLYFKSKLKVPEVYSDICEKLHTHIGNLFKISFIIIIFLMSHFCSCFHYNMFVLNYIFSV